MKTLFIITGMLLATVCLTKAQCNSNYYRFEEGAEFELTTYNDKDKAQSRMVNKIISIEEQGGAFQAVVQLKMYDKKDKLIHEGEHEVTCDGNTNTIRINMERFVPAEMMEAYQGMEVIFEGDYLEIPSDLQVGQSLPDGAVSMQVKTAEGGMNLSNINIGIVNRKVVAEESITTPAGTFNCKKLSYDTESLVKALGLGKPRVFKSAEWLAEGIGLVRSEAYDEKGRLMSYTLLTAYK